MPTSRVLFDVDGPIAFLTFNRPEARNAMTWEMYEALVEACDRVDADANVRVFVLRGAGGKAFVSGTDIGQFTGFSTRSDVVGYEVEVDRSNRDFAEDVAFLQVDTHTNAVIAYDVSIRGSEFMNTWYRVRAVDADGNRSVGSNSVYVATGRPETEDPTVPEEPPIARPVSD